MVELCPTATRFVDIHHTGWDLKWCIQLPETITSMNGVTMMWQQIRPCWIQTGDHAWAYEWKTTPEYIKEQLGYSQTDSSGNVIRHNFIIGLALRVEVAGFEDGMDMALTLRNESSSTFYEVISDGGCFQAKSPEFRDPEEVERSFVLINGKPESMSDLHRTVDIRTTYRADLKDYDKAWLNINEWFWGRSAVAIDRPAVLGAVSHDRSKAVAIGYEGAISASQNADQHHHCLHSRPHFGDIAPGQSATRKGFILFGTEPFALAQRLCMKLGGLQRKGKDL